MAHRAWFTLVIRAVGVLLLGGSLSYGVAFVAELVGYILQARIGSVESLLYWAVSELGTLTQCVFGLYLLFGGKRLIDWCLRSVGNLCQVCGYDLRGLAAANCPECGSPVPADDRTGSAGTAMPRE